MTDYVNAGGGEAEVYGMVIIFRVDQTKKPQPQIY
jgi:hypothetical protein